MSQSNESQVVIKNVGFGLAGNFSCEVTADAPLFSTGTAYNQMTVVGTYTMGSTLLPLRGPWWWWWLAAEDN